MQKQELVRDVFDAAELYTNQRVLASRVMT